MFDTSVAERPIDRRRAQTRQEIVDAAWRLCRERGLAALSLRDLADRVGLRASSLYSYFASKDAIYDAMFAEGQRELAAHLAFLPDDGVTRDDFHRGVRTFFEFCVADPVRYQLLFQRTLPGFTPSDDSYALAVQIIERLDRQLASLGIHDRRLRDLWTALLTGLTAQQISNDPGGHRWESLIVEAVDMFLDHAGVDPAPTRTTPRRTR